MLALGLLPVVYVELSSAYPLDPVEAVTLQDACNAFQVRSLILHIIFINELHTREPLKAKGEREKEPAQRRQCPAPLSSLTTLSTPPFIALMSFHSIYFNVRHCPGLIGLFKVRVAFLFIPCPCPSVVFCLSSIASSLKAQSHSLTSNDLPTAVPRVREEQIQLLLA